MVQLREQDVADKAGVVVFQFQYGTIKRIKAHNNVYSTLRFNSNMVQLRVLCSIYPQPCRLFQFQYGTIKRKHQPEKKKRKKVVSIPIWYN